jgi:lysophospholipase L1-like esterase
MQVSGARRLVPAVITVLTVLVAVLVSPSTANAAGNPALQGVRYVAYGHSFGQVQPGTGSTPATLYPSLVRDDLQTDPSSWANRTVSGASTADILARTRSTWQQGDYGLVTFLGNQNDVGRHVPEATFKANVRGFVNWVRGPGPFPPTVVLVLDTTSTAAGYARYRKPPTDADVIRYNRYLRDVAGEYPKDRSVVLADAFTGWDEATMLSPDGQHPNDTGQAHIAQAIETAVAGLPPREGQNTGVTATTTHYDSFNRRHSAAGLGAATDGKSYTTYGGAAYGISANRASRSSGPTRESAAVLNTGRSSVDLSMTMVAISSKGAGPVWRLTDANDYFVLDIHGTGTGNAKVYKRVKGKFTQVGSALTRPVGPGSVVRVVHSGARITAFVDGVKAYTALDAFNGSATRHGFRITEAGKTRIDDLLVR